MIKADGLAAGKGVTIAETIEQAHHAIDECLTGPFAEIVIEEFLQGEEASFFALVDGDTTRCRSPRRKTTSACSTATRDRTPAAWAPIRRRRS